jgi:hypothetical protein
MIGTKQSSTLRIPVSASAATIDRYLTEAELLRQWLWPQALAADAPEQLETGSEFSTCLGPLQTGHRVTHRSQGRLILTLWGAVDGWNDWIWGDGWVQLRVEAISVLPVGVCQSILLNRLQAILERTGDCLGPTESHPSPGSAQQVT